MRADWRECAGCAEMFLGRGRAKWCSESCRKSTLYSTPCVDCGAPTDGSNGHGDHASLRCQKCSGAIHAERMKERWAPHRAQIERLWAEGKTLRAICEQLGLQYQRPYLTQWRSRGYDLPHRRTPEQVARMSVIGKRNLVKARARLRAAA